MAVNKAELAEELILSLEKVEADLLDLRAKLCAFVFVSDKPITGKDLVWEKSRIARNE